MCIRLQFDKNMCIRCLVSQSIAVTFSHLFYHRLVINCDFIYA